MIAWLLSAVSAQPPPPPPQFTTLESINYAATDADACSTSPYIGQNVTTRGYVSAVRANGFYMQSSDYSEIFGGIWVYFSAQRRADAELISRAAGDHVEVFGIVTERYQLTSLVDPLSVMLISTGHMLTPEPVTTDAIGLLCRLVGEQYESLLVTVTNAVIVSEANQYGNIQVNDGSGITQLAGGLLNTDAYLTWTVGGPLVNTTLTSVTGIVRFAFGSFSLDPRDIYDVSIQGYDADAAVPLRTLFEIQFVDASADACAAAANAHQMVTTRGYISAVAANGFYMQHELGGSLWGGIWVHFSARAADSGLVGRQRGQFVELVSFVQDYNGLTELENPTAVTVLSSGHVLTPLALTTGELGTICTRSGESYEGLLVMVTNAQLMAPPNRNGELLVDDGTGLTQLEDDLFETDVHISALVGASNLVGTMLGSVAGVVRYTYAKL